MTAKSTTATPIPPKKTRKAFKRGAVISKAEKEIVANIVHEQTADMTPQQVKALAIVLKRTPELIKNEIALARDTFVGRAGRYVDIHLAATESALETGDNEQAIKASQWAVSNISGEGTRIIDRPNTEATGSRVMIGIKVGGVDAPDITTISIPSQTTDE